VGYFLTVYVPQAGHPEVDAIDPGSGIVGLPTDDGRIAIHFEGNRYGAVNMERLADRVAQAAARLRFEYPTVAKAQVSPESLVAIGRYDGVEGRIELADEDARQEVCRWLGVQRLDPRELERSDARSAPA
jgi:hypothetical protein